MHQCFPSKIVPLYDVPQCHTYTCPPGLCSIHLCQGRQYEEKHAHQPVPFPVYKELLAWIAERAQQPLLPQKQGGPF